VKSGRRIELRQGGDGPVALRGRVLTEADVDAVLTLHLELVRGVAADLVATETREFFADHVARCGRLFGYFAGPDLVAYAVLGLPGVGDPNFGVDHDLTTEQLARVAHLDGAGVDPRYRGHGLQQNLTRWRLDAARAVGRTIALSTVAPANGASLDNALACGLTARALAVRYGGWRYLLRRDLDRKARMVGEQRWVAGQDLDTQQALLQAGWRGWRARGRANREILFAQACDEVLCEPVFQRAVGAAGASAGTDSASSAPRRPDSRQ
jgi:GNAT superfamily N-acetyltransferase